MSRLALPFALLLTAVQAAVAYPMDGYPETGIRRLELVRLRVARQLSGPVVVKGSRRSIRDIHLNLAGPDSGRVRNLPPPDPGLQARIEALFPDRDASYSIAVLDITPGRPVRYAGWQENVRYPPGSVGKLAIAAGLFAELARLYPDDPERRRQLLRTRLVPGGRWVAGDHHPVPFYDPADSALVSRPAAEGDVFSLYEWADHMLSASANSAGSVVWKEVMLMRAFGAAYPPSPEQEEAYFKSTPKSELQRLSLTVVNDPLRAAGIGLADWQLGTFFTDYGQAVVPGTSSYASPRALVTYLLRLEQGRIVDPWSSLEIKRLIYMTARRIRYASSPAIAASAVYFKSGSLYACKPEEGFRCGKYMGNVKNYMNSVAIVETTDGKAYLVALMSNVLRKNSAVDHQTLATEIQGILGR
ncbi:MAG: serine hydrolase [Gemmatimonadota bacterium]